MTSCLKNRLSFRRYPYLLIFPVLPRHEESWRLCKLRVHFFERYLHQRWHYFKMIRIKIKLSTGSKSLTDLLHLPSVDKPVLRNVTGTPRPVAASQYQNFQRRMHGVQIPRLDGTIRADRIYPIVDQVVNCMQIAKTSSFSDGSSFTSSVADKAFPKGVLARILIYLVMKEFSVLARVQLSRRNVKIRIIQISAVQGFGFGTQRIRYIVFCCLLIEIE